MDDLRAGIEILPRAGEGAAGELYATSARLVLRLYIFFDQFSIVE